jgi:tetrahydromethanopterin S-methyltransferase subunit G
VTKGKQWTIQQETELKTLVEANTRLEEIATKLQKTPGAIILKGKRLGLNIDAKGYVKTSVPMPRDLPSVEEALKMIAGALKTAIKPGLDKTEVQRLQAVATIAKTYKELLADYINYREIETKLNQVEEQNAQLLKERSQNTSPQPNPAPMA